MARGTRNQRLSSAGRAGGSAVEMTERQRAAEALAVSRRLSSSTASISLFRSLSESGASVDAAASGSLDLSSVSGSGGGSARPSWLTAREKAEMERMNEAKQLVDAVCA